MASEASGLRFLLDENVSRHIARAFRALGEDVRHLGEVYGESTKDHEWIPRASADGYVVICGDRQIRRVPIEREALLRNQLGIFFLQHGVRKHCVIVQALIKHWPTIKRLARETKAPYQFVIGQKNVTVFRMRGLRS